jgi:Zn-finger nucleic acid-binding protein
VSRSQRNKTYKKNWKESRHFDDDQKPKKDYKETKKENLEKYLKQFYK